MDLTNKNQLLEYLKKNNLWAKKGLSQNFLIDREALDKIVEAAEFKPPPAPPLKGGEDKGDLVIEVGPGLGVLTQELVSRAGKVIAVEMDEQLATILSDRLSTKFEARNSKQIINHNDKNTKQVSDLEFEKLNIVSDFDIRISDLNHHLTIINSDILKLNLDEVIPKDRPYKVVANIPYHITSKILELFLSREQKPELMVLLVQKEVAERICAKPGNMSVLAVSVQLYGKPEIVDIVPKEAFFPSPKVDSAIIKIADVHTPTFSPLLRGSVEGVDEKAFFRLVHIGFSARRKTLLNNLSVGYQLERKTASDILKEVGLSDSTRAQELSIEEWKKLNNSLNDKIRMSNAKQKSK